MAAVEPLEQLVLDDRVHGRIYVDEDVFKAEMERIFAQCWLYVGHESEVPEPGAYKTTWLVDQPVIVSRGSDDGKIRVLFNRCRHRAAIVCQNERGYANFFRCAYHGWTYSNDGRLTGCPFQDGYGKDFKKEEMGLVPVPQMGIYQGFIFAKLTEGGPTLEEYLGHARPFIDQVAALAPGGIELSAGVQRGAYNGNWKLQIENSIDPYHFGFVHESFLELKGKKRDWIKEMRESTTRQTMDLGNGHSVSTTDHEKLGIGSYTQPFSLILFPNLVIIGSQVRVVRPLAPKRTEVSIYPMMLKGVPDEVNEQRLRTHEAFYGPAGFGLPDDLEVAFHRVHLGLQAQGNPWLIISRGVDRERVDEKGIRYGGATDEVPQRAFYRQWRRMIAAGAATG